MGVLYNEQASYIKQLVLLLNITRLYRCHCDSCGAGVIMAKLTVKQEVLFNSLKTSLRKQVALEYIKLGYDNGTKAYLNACKKLKKKPARSPVSASSEILNNPDVIEFIDSVRVKVAEKVQIDAEWVLEQAVDMFKVCRDAGQLNPAKGFLELAGKHCNINAFKERIELDATIQVTKIEREIV